MNQLEYDFLSGNWKGIKGAAYNQAYEYCKEFGWIMGFSDHDEPIPTQKGIEPMSLFRIQKK